MTSEENSDHAEEALCAWLCDNSSIDRSEIERIRKIFFAQGQADLPLHLLRLGAISDGDLAKGWSEVLQVPLFTEEIFNDDMELVGGISERFLRHYHALVLTQGEETWLVMANPSNQQTIRAVHYACGNKPRIAVASASLIEAKHALYHGVDRSANSAFTDIVDSEAEGHDDIEQLKDMASEAPVIRMVNQLLQKAVEQRASDIHVEPFEKTLKVRYRIDGILHDIEAPPTRSAAAVISRIKIMARLDIAERRLPQDGRIMLRVQGRSLDLRVSTVPTSFGESVVMRLLDRSTIRLDFPSLGFDGKHLSRFTELLNVPHGIVLVTGPTGSGKTTTLYTALGMLNEVERKIITVEDPVEYQLEGANQIQVKPSIGLDFPGALRAIMRQDPDVIMIGEMRDLATCRIAIQAALTGHLVLSTLHTNSAAESVTRLLDMGVESYLLASTLRGVLAQRLVRKLDPATRIAYEPSARTEEQLGLREYCEQGPITLYRPDPDAPGGGYLGRSAVTELLVLDDAIREMLVDHASAQRIEAAARQQQAFRSLREDGIRQALMGVTSIEEVHRVTGAAP